MVPREHPGDSGERSEMCLQDFVRLTPHSHRNAVSVQQNGTRTAAQGSSSGLRRCYHGKTSVIARNAQPPARCERRVLNASPVSPQLPPGESDKTFNRLGGEPVSDSSPTPG